MHKTNTQCILMAITVHTGRQDMIAKETSVQELDPEINNRYKILQGTISLGVLFLVTMRVSFSLPAQFKGHKGTNRKTQPDDRTIIRLLKDPEAKIRNVYRRTLMIVRYYAMWVLTELAAVVLPKYISRMTQMAHKRSLSLCRFENAVIIAETEGNLINCRVMWVDADDAITPMTSDVSQELKLMIT
ncbi:hypothetical protein CAPTEDRAFT_215958 [Capitella teleta]|uniref:Uncharacterized protein n=1 Tax=Capitella teleta TaxID=283909 RepID=R7V9D5_CAPTE|nr:hypothetical protein CAPTEDRAFT_215958 [Capitella teleta]|eukprot:ELU15112.1 hypothetical protein CAPTEDRAFT_215958 [Capitella teleta]